jgi:CRP-like cAMP-binding protein
MIAVTHDKLAARCGLSRPKLSQELKRLELAGTLRLHRGAIEIVDRRAFAYAT